MWVMIVLSKSHSITTNETKFTSHVHVLEVLSVLFGLLLLVRSKCFRGVNPVNPPQRCRPFHNTVLEMKPLVNCIKLHDSINGIFEFCIASLVGRIDASCNMINFDTDSFGFRLATREEVIIRDLLKLTPEALCDILDAPLSTPCIKNCCSFPGWTEASRLLLNDHHPATLAMAEHFKPIQGELEDVNNRIISCWWNNYITCPLS